MRYLILIALVLASSVRVAAATDDIVIGWIGPLTGPSAVLGVDSVEVARQTFDEVNSKGGIAGHKIRFVVEDDQYLTAKTVAAYARLVSVEHARVIFVLTYGGIKAVARNAERDGVLLLDPLDCDDELAALPQNTFCIAKRTEDLGIQNAQHAISKQHSPAAIIYFEGDPFPIKVAESTKRTLEAAGVKVVLYAGVPPGATSDFRSLLSVARRQKAKALFVYGYDDFGLALKQAKEIGLDVTFYSVPGAGLGSPGFDSSAGDAREGVLAGGWFAPRSQAYQDFRDNYKAKIGRFPFLDVSTVPTHDISHFLILGLKSVSTEKNEAFETARLRSYLYELKNYNGLSGTITIDAYGGVTTLKVGMYVYRNGNFEPIK